MNKPEKNRLPIELQNCYMEIHRKEQNLTPLLNQVRNDAVDEYEKFLPSEKELLTVLIKDYEDSKALKAISIFMKESFLPNLAKAIARRIGK